MFRCPSDVGPEYNPTYAGYSASNYAVVHGAGISAVYDDVDQQGSGAFSEASSVAFDDLQGGASQTLLMGERAGTQEGGGAAIWMRSVNRTGDGDDGTAVAGVCSSDARLNDKSQLDAFSSWHTGGAHFLFGDGSVRYVNQQIDLKTYEAQATIALD